jgi:ribosomal protein L16 Arg81 hydroxylase
MVNLHDILAPLSVEVFRQEYLGRKWLHLRHDNRHLIELIDLRVISNVLTHLRVTGRRVRMAKGGDVIPSNRYLHDPGHPSGSRINPVGLIKEARTGATLVIDSVDELIPDVWKLADDCERQLGAPVRVNSYASWSENPGFDLHWDEHDVLVLQTVGRKKWTIYEPTMVHPVQSAECPRPAVPVGPPVFEDELVPGSVLYMPRGWWHIAQAVEFPSLHITIGLNGQNGVDVLCWAAKRLFDVEAARMDIPLYAGDVAQREWLEALQQHLATILSRPGMLAECGEAYQRQVKRRHEIDLLGTIRRYDTSNHTNDEHTSLIQMLQPLSLSHGDSGRDDRTSLRCGSVVLRCSRSLSGSIQKLAETDSPRLSDLSAGLTIAQRKELRTLVNALVTCGVARIASA